MTRQPAATMYWTRAKNATLSITTWYLQAATLGIRVPLPVPQLPMRLMAEPAATAYTMPEPKTAISAEPTMKAFVILTKVNCAFPPILAARKTVGALVYHLQGTCAVMALCADRMKTVTPQLQMVTVMAEKPAPVVPV